MLVVDTNVISYLYLPTEYTKYSEALIAFDAHWAAPVLWKSEFRNVLSLYWRKNIIDLATALDMQHQAELLLADNEFQVESNNVLALAQASGCSAYDCEFISLAQFFTTKLISNDKKLIKAFPDHAVSLRDFIAQTR